MQIEWTAIQNADTPILTDGLMSLMPFSKPTASNEADWREARMWLREMAGMGLHRIRIHYGWDDPDFADEVKI